MTLLNVERIKLFSTKSPYWCLLLILALGGLISTLFAFNVRDAEISLTNSQFWSQMGLMVAMVMSALAITTEYRFGTIRNSFLAVPKRTSVLVSKTILVAAISATMGILTSLLAYGITAVISGNPNGQLDINSATDWRIVIGSGVTFAIGSVIAIAVGTLIRQSAGAITILMLWPLLVEGIVSIFGETGRKISEWLPFQAGSHFTQGDPEPFEGQLRYTSSAPNWVEGILVFGGTAAVLWIAALVILKRRDA